MTIDELRKTLFALPGDLPVQLLLWSNDDNENNFVCDGDFAVTHCGDFVCLQGSGEWESPLDEDEDEEGESDDIATDGHMA